MAAPESDAELLEARMDSNGQVVLGKYVKADKGVSFELLEEGKEVQFRFEVNEGELKINAITIEENEFTVEGDYWDPKYGDSVFEIDLRNPLRIVLKENGVNDFYLVSGQVGTEQLHVFKDVGALVVHHAVPPWLLEAALNSVQKIVGAAVTKAQGGKPESIPFHDDNTKEEAVLALAKPLWPLVRVIVGDLKLACPTTAQVVVRCQAQGEATAAGEISTDVHIDGLHSPGNGDSPGNGVKKDTVEPFTLLLGIPLQDCDGSTQRGNFSFVPGSHKAMARGASRKATADAAADCLKQADRPYETIKKFVDLDMLAAPVQVMCKAGGAFLAHYLTLHYGQPNRDREASVTVYFRVKAATNQWPKCLLRKHMFDDMPGLPVTECWCPHARPASD